MVCLIKMRHSNYSKVCVASKLISLLAMSQFMAFASCTQFVSCCVKKGTLFFLIHAFLNMNSAEAYTHSKHQSTPH